MTCLYCGGIHDPTDLDRIKAKYEITDDGWMICPTCRRILETMDTDAMLIKLVSAPIREGYEKAKRNQVEDNLFGRVSETLHTSVSGCS